MLKTRGHAYAAPVAFHVGGPIAGDAPRICPQEGLALTGAAQRVLAWA